MERSGPPASGGVSLPELLAAVGSVPELLPLFGWVPWVPSLAMLAVLEICEPPAATGFPTVTANVAVWLPPPAARVPMLNVQVEAALLLGVQLQPAVLAPALNVV